MVRLDGQGAPTICRLTLLFSHRLQMHTTMPMASIYMVSHADAASTLPSELSL